MGPAAPRTAVTRPPPHTPPSRGHDRTIPTQRLGQGQGRAPSHLQEVTEPQSANQLPGRDPTEEHPGDLRQSRPGAGAMKSCLQWRNHGRPCVMMVVTSCGVGSSPLTGPRVSPQGPGCKGGTRAEGWGLREGWGVHGLDPCRSYAPTFQQLPPPLSGSFKDSTVS